VVLARCINGIDLRRGGRLYAKEEREAGPCVDHLRLPDLDHSKSSGETGSAFPGRDETLHPRWTIPRLICSEPRLA